MCVSAFAHLLQQFLVVTLSSSDYRCKQVALSSVIFLHNEGDDLLVGVPCHLLPRVGRICGRCPGVQQTQEIVYFSDGSDSGARIVAGGLLLYGDDGAESRNGLDLRLFQYAHKVFGICGKRVHISPLSLGIDRVEGEGRLAASAESRHHDKTVARDGKRRSLKVVRLSSDNLYEIVLLLHLETFWKTHYSS